MLIARIFHGIFDFGAFLDCKGRVRLSERGLRTWQVNPSGQFWGDYLRISSLMSSEFARSSGAYMASAAAGRAL